MSYTDDFHLSGQRRGTGQKGRIRASFSEGHSACRADRDRQGKQGTVEKALLKSGKRDNDSWD